jgi:hypothetical protein
MPQQLPDEVLYDVRLIERHVRSGLLSREQADKRLKDSKDVVDNADAMDLDQLETEISGRSR